MIPGRATLDGTRRFAARSRDAAEGHFREAVGLSLSSLGLGTYLGAEDARTDAGYEAAVRVALGSGINVFDSAINYRGQKSERAIGRALAGAFREGLAARDEVFVCTKGGFLPHDADDPRPPRRYVQDEFAAPGLAPADAVAQGCHCIAPAYVRDQIGRSRANLGLETIDLYYLHNLETQLGDVDRPEFDRRLEAAAEVLEEEASAGRIAAWGAATWDGLRVPPDHPDHLSLEALLAVARKVGGEGHRFRAVQLPTNLGMTQSVVYRSQSIEGRRMPALEGCSTLGLAAFGSVPILQGRAVGVDFPEAVADAFPEARSSLLQALQFARSAPGMTAALVGVSDPEHAAEDFALARVPPAPGARVLDLFV